ncbi:3-phosphoshikimate 1-carboxyvinyltransferase [Bacteroidota bacterium]
MIQKFPHINSVRGSLKLPGDKSISHRAVMFASLAEGRSEITNCLEAADIKSTINCFRALGCEIIRLDDKVVVKGCGFKRFKKPAGNLDAGNSGTTARLISGILAVQNFESCVVGDDSLSKRPMERIVSPLKLMGADIKASQNGTLPLRFGRVNNLNPISYKLPVASAQIKSALLLAGLHLDETTTVIEDEVSRNHTEVFLNLKIDEADNCRNIYVSKKDYPESFNLFVPSDISSASFFIVLTLLSKNSELRIVNVLLNETRTGILKVLRKMGGKIEIENERESHGEKFGDLIVKSSELNNIKIPDELIPNIIDEIPILTIAGLFAEGPFEIYNAGELRHKESDRISSLCENMKVLNLDINEFQDGFCINGEMKSSHYLFNSYGDHRIAMAFAILSSVLDDGGSIDNYECVNISNPNFIEQIRSISH